jgi:hypothetical protein
MYRSNSRPAASLNYTLLVRAVETIAKQEVPRHYDAFQKLGWLIVEQEEYQTAEAVSRQGVEGSNGHRR